MRKKNNRREAPRRYGKHGGSRRSLPEVTGRVQMTREGYIFVIVGGDEPDVYVKASKTRMALDGDIVRVAVTREAGEDHRREGEVIAIEQRSGRQFVGLFHTVGAQAWVLMESRNMPYDIEVRIDDAFNMGAKRGMKVAAVVDRWDRKDPCPKGHLVDVLGMPGENDTEMHAILAEFNLPYRFEKEVEDAADQISDKITPRDIKGREDFRKTLTFTIDPADAKDFDDALSFKKLPNGNYEVGVHIADVSYYVKPGTAVDKEARERGTSVYLVDRTVPMLPEKLCNKLCSLRQDEDKLTFSTVFEITPKAKVVNSWIGRTIICSDRRYCYEEAQEIIEKGTADTPLEDAILTLYGLSSILKKDRARNAAIDFDRPEMKVEVDELGRPVRVYEKISKEANWLIEEFMLLANRTVAEFIATNGKMNGKAQRNARTFVYRIHDEPNGEKLQSLREFAGTLGYKMKGESLSGREAARSLNDLLSKAKGSAEYSAFENIALRAMAKAKYSTDNIGHYGLAFPFYTHFTSPIRRYPDTMVHRLLSMYLAGADSQSKDYYEMECQHASEREVIAADAERTSVKYKLVEYMQDKVGDEFDGHVSSITEWGMYVEIEPTKIEGMVPLREIKSDWFEFDESHYSLVGRRSGRVFRLGDAVRICVKRADLGARQLDFSLVEQPIEKRKKPTRR